MIDGADFPELSRISVRFVFEEGAYHPVIYRDGKRVTKPFGIAMLVEREGDKFGGNANTE